MRQSNHWRNFFCKKDQKPLDINVITWYTLIMDKMEQIEALRAKAEKFSVMQDAIECADVDIFTAKMERECDRLRNIQLRLQDAADRLECELWMQDADFADQIVRNIKPMPPGPVETGEATIWHNGTEYGCTDIWHWRTYGRPMRNGGIND